MGEMWPPTKWQRRTTAGEEDSDSDEYTSSRVLLAGFVGNALHQYTQEYHQSQLGLGSQTFIAGKDHLFSM
jgi:hypothetical protein